MYFCMNFIAFLNLNMFEQYSYITISGETGWYNRKNNYHRLRNIIQREDWNDGCSLLKYIYPTKTEMRWDL